MLDLCISRYLSDLAKRRCGLNVKEVREILQDRWGAQNVDILDASGDSVHGRTLLQNLLDDRFCLTFKVACEPHAADSRSGEHEEDDRSEEEGHVEEFEELGGEIDTVSHMRGHSVYLGDEKPLGLFSDPRFTRFIRELNKLVRTRKFVWIGYLAKEMLPQLGFAAHELNEVLDRSREDGIITIAKVPNPKNPDFPATSVQLNHEHPVVRLALDDGRPKERKFPLGRINGEPLSETIIRERR